MTGFEDEFKIDLGISRKLNSVTSSEQYALELDQQKQDKLGFIKKISIGKKDNGIFLFEEKYHKSTLGVC